VAIGFALAAAIFISGPISGAGVNPARALGPMIVAGTFTDWWVYLVAPLAGGAVAAVVYHRFLHDGARPSGASSTAAGPIFLRAAGGNGRPASQQPPH
jgi:hypothetical protein